MAEVKCQLFIKKSQSVVFLTIKFVFVPCEKVTQDSADLDYVIVTLWFVKKIESAFDSYTKVLDVEFHPNPNNVSSANKYEPSGNSASHSSGNGYKPPQLIRA